MDSILNTIKKMLGLDPSCIVFDTDIKVGINSVFMTLNQLGVGPSETFHIDDEGATWSDFLEGDKGLEAVKSLIYLRARLGFDPPTNATVIAALEAQAKELEWRLTEEALRTKVGG